MRAVIILLIVMLSLPASYAAEKTYTAVEIVTASDAIRNPQERPFSLNVQLIEYKGGVKDDEMELLVYAAKESQKSGRYSSLVRFIKPVRDDGKLMLKDGNILWFYDPASKASVRISPEQRMMGQVSNGDVVTVDFHNDYEAHLDGIETVADGDKRMTECYRLTMKAKDDSATYDKIDYWVAKQTMRPVKGKFYAQSGRLLKIAFYRGYRQELAVERPTEVIIIDGLNKDYVTKMIFSDYKYRDFPRMWLQKDYLPHFKPE
ncbi:MAG: outer membrane lipoprotein-sorting protein [Candidatus Magnetominusculus sp. LBB02]|nr:outer membrane lipoprotein-sorting protein [Candidatus Magnetominusculus sp. LBB02]